MRMVVREVACAAVGRWGRQETEVSVLRCKRWTVNKVKVQRRVGHVQESRFCWREYLSDAGFFLTIRLPPRP